MGACASSGLGFEVGCRPKLLWCRHNYLLVSSSPLQPWVVWVEPVYSFHSILPPHYHSSFFIAVSIFLAYAARQNGLNYGKGRASVGLPIAPKGLTMTYDSSFRPVGFMDPLTRAPIDLETAITKARESAAIGQSNGGELHRR